MTRELFPRVFGDSTMDDCTPYGCTGDMRSKARRVAVCWEAHL
jgi:hypothetical protein